MKTKTWLASAAAVALIASTSLAGAQGMDKGGANGAGAPPAASGGAAPGGQMNRGESPAMKGGGSEMRPNGGAAKQDAAPDSRAQRDGASPAQRSQDKAGDTTTQDRNQNRAQDSKQPADATKSAQDAKQPADATKSAGDREQSKTTGQAGAGAKITTEQRTQITTVIKQQNVRPVTNVNFSISVGTRVPRGGGITFHALPQPVLAIYPEWRGYEYILVGNDIVVIDPRTEEIVAVLPA